MGLLTSRASSAVAAAVRTRVPIRRAPRRRGFFFGVRRCSPTKMKVVALVHVCRLRVSFFSLFFSLLCSAAEVSGIGEVIYAINAGGEAHTDIHGVHYQKDPLQGKVGTASDFGKQLLVGRVPPADILLYQTERYHLTTFAYDVPVRDDGDYVLVLKFCEVYFTASNLKVFDVRLNGALTVISDLDIYDKVGRGVAHDEYVPFKVSKGKLIVGDSDVEFGAVLHVEFVKGPKDNPKVNAIYVMKGTVDDVPKLPPLEVEEDLFKEEPQGEPASSTKNRRPSGPRSPDPYTLDESSTMLPIFIALVAFIPILFCLCKL